MLIDLDPHHSLSLHLGVDSTQINGVEYYLNGERTFKEVLQSYNDNIDFIPAGKKLAVYESKLYKLDPGDTDKYYSIKNAFADISGDYEYLIIDCPPSLGMLTVNALAHVNTVYIPIQCHYFALEGTAEVVELINDIRKLYNKDLKIGAVIPVMYDVRNKISDFVIDKLKEHFSDLVTETKIRVNIALAEAPAFGKTIFDYSKNCHGAWDFKRLAEEIRNKG